jgi:hypothetical protein
MQRILPLILAGYLLAFGFIGHESIDSQALGANVADLRTQLESGLKCRRPEEFAFVSKVVTMVGNDTLPLDLVMSTFLWTRKNPKAREYPFVYFQQALRERAKKLGIDV